MYAFFLPFLSLLYTPFALLHNPKQTTDLSPAECANGRVWRCLGAYMMVSHVGGLAFLLAAVRVVVHCGSCAGF